MYIHIYVYVVVVVVVVFVTLSTTAIVMPSIWLLPCSSAFTASLISVVRRGKCRIIEVGDILSVALKFLKSVFL